MKKLNKIMLFLAAAVFTLTACEKNVERTPSPEDPQGAVAFTSAGGTRELNMQKEALEQKVTLIRTQDIDKAASLTLHCPRIALALSTANTINVMILTY